MSSVAGPRLQHVCSECRQTFGTYQALEKHKKERFYSDQGHIHCHLCGTFFANPYTLIRHFQQTHPTQQNLTCPGCGMRFNRMSGFVAHVDRQQCPRIHRTEIKELRESKLNFARELEKRAGSSLGTSITGSEAGDTSNWEAHAVHRSGNGHNANLTFSEKQSFPSLADQAGPNDHNKLGQGDLLSSYDAVDGSKEDKQPWGRQTMTGPPVTRPTPQQLAAATTPNAKSKYLLGIHDPGHPHFDAEKYKGWSELYECPMTGCPISFNTATEITQHLRTAGVHGGRKPQCPCCLKYFKDITSLTAHVESESIRCPIRKSTKYREFIDTLTAGLIDTVTASDDISISYEVSNEAVVRFGQPQRFPKTVPGQDTLQSGTQENDESWARDQPDDAAW